MGTTTRGKGTQVMAVADRAGLPLATHVKAAPPHEVTLVEPTLAAGVVDARLAGQGIERIAPHRSNRKQPKTQDGRPLRRYTRRWNVERLFAW